MWRRRNRNPNCDKGHCILSHSEVRVYPTGGGSNLILCHNCWMEENQYRAERNETLKLKRKDAFPIRDWFSAKVYRGD